MSFTYLSACWRLNTFYPTTTHLDQLVLMAVAEHANGAGECWPSQSTIARRTGAARESVCRSLARLAELGIVRKLRRFGDRGVWVIKIIYSKLPGPDIPPDDEPEPGLQPEPPPRAPTSQGLCGQVTGPVTRDHKEPVIEPVIEELPLPTASESAENGQRKRAARPRDETWDTLLTACGIDSNGPLPTSARGAYNKAVRELKALGVSAAEITERASTHRRVWPKVSLTPNSLVRHWAELAPERPAAAQSEADRHPSARPAREVLQDAFRGARPAPAYTPRPPKPAAARVARKGLDHFRKLMEDPRYASPTVGPAHS